MVVGVKKGIANRQTKLIIGAYADDTSARDGEYQHFGHRLERGRRDIFCGWEFCEWDVVVGGEH